MHFSTGGRFFLKTADWMHAPPARKTGKIVKVLLFLLIGTREIRR